MEAFKAEAARANIDRVLCDAGPDNKRLVNTAGFRFIGTLRGEAARAIF